MHNVIRSSLKSDRTSNTHVILSVVAQSDHIIKY
jgi:hypothetical protein